MCVDFSLSVGGVLWTEINSLGGEKIKMGGARQELSKQFYF